MRRICLLLIAVMAVIGLSCTQYVKFEQAEPLPQEFAIKCPKCVPEGWTSTVIIDGYKLERDYGEIEVGHYGESGNWIPTHKLKPQYRLACRCSQGHAFTYVIEQDAVKK